MTEHESTAPATVLVVDDLPQNTVALAAVLDGLDLRVVCVHSGLEALEVLMKEDVAVALIDVQMPVMDGFQLAEAMRGMERTRHVPIIFVTAGAADPQRMFRGYESGGVDFLLKPLDPRIIRSKVDVFIQLRRARDELRHRVEELGEMVRLNDLISAILAHDLRTPLQSVLLCAQVLHRLQAPAPVGEIAQRVERSAGRMRRLIDQMLELSRMRAGTFILRRCEVDAHALALELCEEFGCQEGNNRVSISAAGDCRGWWDPDRIAQLLANLLSNALSHSPPGTPVRLVLDGGEDGALRVRVINDGAIAPEQLQRLLEPFRYYRESTSGLGLGLFIAREIVAAHGGSMRAACEDGACTVFEAILPRRAVEAEQPAAAGASPTWQGRPGPASP